MRNMNWLVLISGLLLAHGAAAEEKAPTWDDSHMQSRFQATPPSSRPRFSGESGYSALANGSAAGTKTAVPEEIEYTSQRQWIQGALTPSDPRESAATPSNSDFSMSRSSQLRSNAVSSSRRY